MRETQQSAPPTVGKKPEDAPPEAAGGAQAANPKTLDRDHGAEVQPAIARHETVDASGTKNVDG